MLWHASVVGDDCVDILWLSGCTIQADVPVVGSVPQIFIGTEDEEHTLGPVYVDPSSC